MAWLYMMDADPYPISLSGIEVDGKFIADLKAVVKEQAEAALGFGGEFSDRPQITARMRAVRAASLEQRRQTYLACRIDDQRRWYSTKARNSQ
jgi:hypothetical protein